MAVRRRLTEPDRGPGLEIPDELRECVVEEWIAPADLELDRTGAAVAAWGRWRRARSAFLSSHGVPRREWCGLIPPGRPRWRSEP